MEERFNRKVEERRERLRGLRMCFEVIGSECVNL
jgi:hypothetical protein